MALSNDLISQFVKMTNDKPETVKESTVYGKAVVQDGKTYVQLDGSDVLTPVTTTANTKDGERVMVVIKNHTATIIGNMSSPSARSEDVENVVDEISEFEILIANKVSTEELEVERGRIDDLQADNVVIKDKLTASEADIDNLQAGILTVTDRLTADEATIENLKTTKLDVSVAKATYATIDDLKATNADIYNLEATYGDFVVLTTDKFESLEAEIAKIEAGEINVEQLKATFATIADLDVERARIDDLEVTVGDIDTLIFGSASGNVIQTSFANAVIAQLGNAQIKSAMIESLSADKITSGDIITNNVRVMSEDGKLLISDETIQISDTIRVRVQIGKDASGDYSISIWDADGKLMFSEGGITDSAIKNAIIRDDMVSDSANISAHKLNIASLFEVINGSTQTIKSSKIMLDSEGQTLDVVFTDLSTTVGELEETISSQGTQLSVVQGQISSKVWQQDITTAIDGVEKDITTLSSQYTTLNQTVDGIDVIVAKHTTELAGKAEQSEVSKVSDQVASLEVGLDGFKTSVSETYATKTDVKNSSKAIEADVTDLTTRMVNAESGITQNTESITAVVSRTETVESGVAAAQNTANAAKKQLWHSAQGEGGDTGYVAFARLTITGSYQNRPIRFSLRNRGTVASDIDIRFVNATNSDPDLQSIRENGDVQTWIVKMGDSTWDVIAKKSEGWDIIYVTDYENNNANITVTWIGDHYYDLTEELPTENLTASTKLIGSAVADTIATKSEITQLDNKITAAVARVSNNESAISKLELTADSLTSRVSSVECDAETALVNSANAQLDIDALKIGGRNLLKDSRCIQLYSNNSAQYPITYETLTENGREYKRYKRSETTLNPTTMSLYSTIPVTQITDWLYDKECAFSFLIRPSHSTTTTTMNRLRYDAENYILSPENVKHTILAGEWTKITVVIWITDEYDPADESALIRFNPYQIPIPEGVINDFYVDVCEWQIEKGNRPTDWTAAPEDVEYEIDAVNDTALTAKETAANNSDQLSQAQTIIQQLSDSISTLVVDESGESLMTQDGDRWLFSMGSFSETLNSVSSDLNVLMEDVGDTKNTVEVLNQAVDDLGVLANYIAITTYNNQPCIELGEADSDFKLRITNTEIQFIEGTSVPAFLSNQKLYITKAEITEELQQGEFVWKARSNGNLGLIWKGGTS